MYNYLVGLIKKQKLFCKILLINILLFSYTHHAFSYDLAFSWTPPTSYEDGDALASLAGCRIYVGQSSGDYDYLINLPSSSTGTVTDLVLGPVYYFTITAYDSNGMESVYSNELVWESMTVAPSVSPASGIYTGAVQLVLSVASENTDIHYTLDGSEPTIDSSMYVIPITISEDTVVKTLSHKEYSAPSHIISTSYIIHSEAGPTPTDGASLTERRPTFDWNTEVSSSWYRIWISRNGVTYVNRWLQQSTSSWTPEFDFEGGAYTWWVQAWGEDSSLSSWNGPYHFDIEACVPSNVTPLNPVGEQETGTLTYTWSPESCSTWYQIWINNDQSIWSNKWIQTGIATDPISTEISNHSLSAYTWWVRGWSEDGISEWSDSHTFNIGKVTVVEPTSVTSGEPVNLKWEDSSSGSSEWFYIWINNDMNIVFKKWIHKNETNLEGSLRVYSLPLILDSGNYSVWIQTWASNDFGPWSNTFDFNVIAE